MTNPSEKPDPAPHLDDMLPGLDAASRQTPAAPRRPCPICKRPVDTASESFPFCTPRCRTVDLAKWATGDYKFTRPMEERDLDVD